MRGAFDAIVANLILSEVAPLLPSIADRLRPAGSLLLSGLLAEQREEMERMLRRQGLAVVRLESEGEWIAFAASRV